uniref:Macroglobulin domain-containing protein n=1 Tax=Aquila chrysaetos chrysaetos TaxID=223781 RepID=A0A663FGL0_AQUCH
MVLFPAVLYYPYTGKVHIHLMDLDEPVRVTLHLASSHGVPNVTLEEQGSSLQVSEWKKVLVKGLELGTLVQTDKDVYKPGQTVKFRIVRLDQNFIPSNRELPLVAVQDPSGNRIAQWREVSPRQGIVDLSLPLAAEPALGTYIIEVEGKSHSFSVEEYVLPKFEMTIDLPPVVLEKDEKFQVEICGRYTYGKPVQGKVQASLCQSFRYTGILHRLHSAPQKETNCIEVSGQKNGCFSTEVLLTAFNLTSSMHEKQFEVQALLVEDGTGRDSGVLLPGNGLCCWCMVLHSSLRAPKCMWHRGIGLLQGSPKAAL